MIQANLPSGIYNVGTGVATEILELSYIIEKKLKNCCNLTEQIKEKTNKSSLNFFADTKKLKKYFTSITFENINSGLLKTIKYFQKNN